MTLVLLDFGRFIVNDFGIYFSRAPPPDVTSAGLGGEPGDGVGSALSSALNVMAFTELDFATGTIGEFKKRS